MPPATAAPTAVAAWRVRAVIPCFNRPGDLAALLTDLACLDLSMPAGGPIELSVLVVDNASDPPLTPVIDAAPAGLDLRLLRLARNAGGSGGFNAGLADWLARGVPGDRAELLWLIDSDARVEPNALSALVAALAADAGLVAAGSALVDPATGLVFELGGHVCHRRGEYVQPAPSPEALSGGPRRVEYVAACSLLVRRWAAEQAGLMPDVFLNGDDVEWCLRLSRQTGLGIAAVPASRVRHPHPDRMRTWARYYAARNAIVAIDASTAGRRPLARRRTRLARAARELGRAMAMALVGRDDLASLHLRGLEDAARGMTSGPAPPGVITLVPTQPNEQLPLAVRLAAQNARADRVAVARGALHDPSPLQAELRRHGIELEWIEAAPRRASLARALGAIVRGPRARVAVVSARGRGSDWIRGRQSFAVAPEGFTSVRMGRLDRLRALGRIVARGSWAAWRLARRPLPSAAPSAAAPSPRRA